jgi:hypothetical protein
MSLIDSTSASDPLAKLMSTPSHFGLRLDMSQVSLIQKFNLSAFHWRIIMKTATSLLAGLVLSALASAAQAQTSVAQSRSYDGHIAFHNDVAYHSIIVTTPGSSLRVWTDSFINGANFDPILAVWHQGARLALNDDNPGIDPANQSGFDSGIVLNNLAVGTYVVTISAYANFPGTVFGGFAYNSQAPIPLDTWCQPANHCDMAKHFSLHWTVN